MKNLADFKFIANKLSVLLHIVREDQPAMLITVFFVLFMLFFSFIPKVDVVVDFIGVNRNGPEEGLARIIEREFNAFRSLGL